MCQSFDPTEEGYCVAREYPTVEDEDEEESSGGSDSNGSGE